MEIIRHAEAELLFEGLSDDAASGPMVSVIVTNFNLSTYIEGCLNSVRSQTLRSIELIVVDDCSTDGRSVLIALKWMKRNKKRFRRCVLVRHRFNQGLAQARNTGYHFSSSSYLFILDVDNEIMPRCIESLYFALSGSEFGAAYSQLEIFGDEIGIGHADVWDPKLLSLGNYIDAMALIARWAFEIVGGYTHIEGGWEDFDLWCKFVDHDIEGIFWPEILCRYRVRRDSMLRTETRNRIDSIKAQLIYRHPWLDLC